MTRRDALTMDGSVTKTERNGMVRVTLSNGHPVLAYICGKMRRHYIKVLIGDRVMVELSPYDLDRGRLVHRY